MNMYTADLFFFNHETISFPFCLLHSIVSMPVKEVNNLFPPVYTPSGASGLFSLGSYKKHPTTTLTRKFSSFSYGVYVKRDGDILLWETYSLPF